MISVSYINGEVKLLQDGVPVCNAYGFNIIKNNDNIQVYILDTGMIGIIKDGWRLNLFIYMYGDKILLDSFTYEKIT